MTMDFVAPRSVELAGSFLLRSVCRPRCVIDVAVEMPQECFLPKDVLDHRYADKRLLYLSVLAQQLRERCDAVQSVEVVGFRPGDAAGKAVLLVTPRDHNKHHKHHDKDKSDSTTTQAKFNRHERAFAFRIIPCLHRATFDTSKLGPTMGNLRKHRATATARLPTPRYNCSILEDMYILRHLRGLFRVAKGDGARGSTAAAAAQTTSRPLPACPSFLDACVLLKAWARRRGMLDAPDTFNGFLLSVLLAQLVCTRAINRNASPRQMFSSFMSYVASQDFGRSGMVLEFMAAADPDASDSESSESDDDSGSDDSGSDSGSDADAASAFSYGPQAAASATSTATSAAARAARHHKVAAQLAAHDVVMIDPGTGLNVASRVSANAYRELRHQATLATAYLGKDTGGAMDTFDPLFLLGSEDASGAGLAASTSAAASSMSAFWHRFDQYAIVYPKKEAAKDAVSRAAWDSTNTLQHLSDTVEQALGDRARLVRVVWDNRRAAPPS